MAHYNVYQQHLPITTGRKDIDGNPIYVANLKRTHTIEAVDEEHALKKAKQLPPFKYATGRLRFPVIEKHNRGAHHEQPNR